MAHRRLSSDRGTAFLRGLAKAAFVLALAACGDPAPPPAKGPALDPRPSGRALSYGADDAGAWGKFHSRRLLLTVPLPDGKAWKIDDHHDVDTVAVHEPTSSRLTIRATQEEELMNRQRCEARAHALGIVPSAADRRFTTVEDRVHVGPDAYDSRIWVAIDAAKPGGAVDGHVFLFGAFLRRCLLIHLTTTIRSTKDEEILATRLAIGTSRIVEAITLDPPRTTDDAIVPKEKPEIRR